MIAPALPTLLAALRCPACGSRRWDADAAGGRSLGCVDCGRTHPVRDGIVQIQLADEHHEVIEERASVPATEGAPELGGWREGYTGDTDPSSPLGQAYLALPYGNGSTHYQEPGYFRNVQYFAPEFDFILQHLPRSGALLDVGADGTWSTARLAERGLSCIALDITDHLVLAHLFQQAYPPYALVNVDMHAPVFADGAFDVVTAFNALHHSTRLETLAANIGRVLKPGGVLGFVEPYVQNAVQEAAFGLPQSAAGINENVHALDRWHRAFVAAGLRVELFALTDAFNAIYRKRADGEPPAEADHDLFARYYLSELTVSPATATTIPGRSVEFEIEIRALGTGAWSAREPVPINLSYHASRETPDGLVMTRFDHERTRLTRLVQPGHPLRLTVPVIVDAPGTYAIEFDLVHEEHCWFKERGGRTAVARLHAS